MKTTLKILKITTVAAAFAVGLIFTFTKCRKDIVVVPVPIHDTLFGKTISGLVQYPDFGNVTQLAKGAVVSLYSGSSKSGSPVATAFADSMGSYSFPYLLPGNYFIWATYNTKNKNNPKAPIEGINFETSPGYPVTMASANLTQDIMLSNVAASGTLKISITPSDTNGSMGAIKTAPFEAHSKCEWWTEYNKDGGIGGTTIQGGFNVFKVTKFFFDEASPANSTIEGYVLLYSINTFEPARDSGCVPQTLQQDTYKLNGVAKLLDPITDTAWYRAPLGSIEKYGKGYLAHGSLEAFYKHQGGNIQAPRVTPLPPDTVSWNGLGPQYAGPWNQRVTNSIDMYFEFQAKNKVWNAAGTTFNWFFIFEGEFTFTRQQYYVKTTSLGNTMHVTPHVQLKGANNVEM